MTPAALAFYLFAVALLTGLHDPATFDAVISLGLPMYNPEWFGEGALEAARDVGVLLVHGTHDEIAPIEATTRARDHLASAGLAVTFRAFDGGHTVPDDQLGFGIVYRHDPGPVFHRIADIKFEIKCGLRRCTGLHRNHHLQR